MPRHSNFVRFLASPQRLLRALCAPFLCVLCVTLSLSGCSHPTKFDPSHLTFLIEANPVNLDPRFATDGQSQRLDGLIFSSLLARDAQMNLHGDLAASWETPTRSLTSST